MAKDPSKTEKATPKRLDKAREKGSVPRSPELPKLTVLMAGLFTLRLQIGTLSEELQNIFTLCLGHRLAFEATSDGVNALFWFLSGKLAIMTDPNWWNQENGRRAEKINRGYTGAEVEQKENQLVLPAL